MKKFLVIALLVTAALVVTHVDDASAACAASGKVLYTNTNAGVTYVYIGQGPTTITVVYMFTTNNVLIQSAAMAASAGGNWVNVLGSAASCPTTGTIRAGGVISTIANYRNY
jgi:hypothetical protein